MAPRVIMWKSEGVVGEERLLLRQDGPQIVATSHVTGGDADLHSKWDAEYRIVCDKNWHVRYMTIQEKLLGCRLEIHSDGNGHWTNEDGKKLENINGCIDIDFRATPFSNTLPVRRLQLATSETSIIEVVYINAPDLKVTKEQQIYTRLSKYDWKFEQPGADFEATIVVDDEGFVLNYPGLFTRT